MFTLMMMITESSNKLRVCHGQQKLKRRNWCMVIIMRPSLYFTADWLYTEICDFELCKNITRQVGFAEQTSVRATAYSRENYIMEQRGHARTREAKGQFKKKSIYYFEKYIKPHVQHYNSHFGEFTESLYNAKDIIPPLIFYECMVGLRMKPTQ